MTNPFGQVQAYGDNTSSPVEGTQPKKSLWLLAGVAIVVSIVIGAGILKTPALGRDFAAFGVLGRWHAGHQPPANALLAQGVIALALVGLGSASR